jgi:mono/diheme cytochrome c family protein
MILAVMSSRRNPHRRRLPGRGLALAGVAAAAAAALVALGLVQVPWPRRVSMTEAPPPPFAFVSGNLANYDLSAFPPSVLRGGRLIVLRRCLECHRINGDGNGKGITLKHVAERRSKPWLIRHFKDPKEFAPTSRMPSYRSLSDQDLSDMADYLLALP